jgi:hypothetical protein
MGRRYECAFDLLKIISGLFLGRRVALRPSHNSRACTLHAQRRANQHPQSHRAEPKTTLPLSECGPVICVGGIELKDDDPNKACIGVSRTGNRAAEIRRYSVFAPRILTGSRRLRGAEHGTGTDKRKKFESKISPGNWFLPNPTTPHRPHCGLYPFTTARATSTECPGVQELTRKWGRCGFRID